MKLLRSIFLLLFFSVAFLNVKATQLTQEEQAIKEQIQTTAHAEVIRAWVSFFEEQELQLNQARNDPAYYPMKLTDGREIDLPIHVLPENYTLIVASVGFNSDEVCRLSKEENPSSSAQSTLFWNQRYLNSASIIKKGLGSYAAATDLQLNMAIIIEPNKNSLIASASKDISAPTRAYQAAIKFAMEKIKLLSSPDDIVKGTYADNYNEVTLMGSLMLNKLFPNSGPSFTVKGIFVTPAALKRYQQIPNPTESQNLLQCLSDLEQKNILVYVPPSGGDAH